MIGHDEIMPTLDGNELMMTVAIGVVADHGGLDGMVALLDHGDDVLLRMILRCGLVSHACHRCESRCGHDDENFLC